MAQVVRKPKDLLSGLLFLVIGAVAMVLLRSYQFGTPQEMGPGFLPTILGGLLVLFGIILVGRSFAGKIDALGQVPLRAPVLILGGALLYGLLLRPAGLAIAVPAMVITGSFASPRIGILGAVISAAILTAASCLVFVYALGQPIPVLGYWFGR